MLPAWNIPDDRCEWLCAADIQGVWFALSFGRMYLHHMAESLCDFAANKLAIPLKDVQTAKGWAFKLMSVLEHAARPALGAEADGEQGAFLS
jgi:hypothetical protein